MKKVLIFVLMLCLSSLFGCKKISDSSKTYGDFIYEIVPLNEDGEDVRYPDVKNKNVVEKFVRIRKITEEAKLKKTLVVPQYVEGIEVKEIGWRGLPICNWNTRVLEKIYIPFLPKKIYDPSVSCQFIILTNVIPDDVELQVYAYITSFYHEEGVSNNFVPEIKGINSYNCSNCRFANVSYMYNYDEAPNDGYYWIDDYEYGEIITYRPEDPIRDGYLFGGWYKEKECINKWNFDDDKLPEEINPGAHQYSYQETILFAKWVNVEENHYYNS